MATKELAGKQIDVTEEGYLVNTSDWTKEVAEAMAEEENIEISEKHFEVLEYIRNKNAKGEGLTIRALGKSGITDIKGLYKLFPGGPLKLSSKLAGISKPASCV